MCRHLFTHRLCLRWAVYTRQRRRGTLENLGRSYRKLLKLLEIIKKPLAGNGPLATPDAASTGKLDPLDDSNRGNFSPDGL